jgi:hypothetical protein
VDDVTLLVVLGVVGLIAYGYFESQKSGLPQIPGSPPNPNNPANQPSGIPGIPNWLDPTYDIGAILGGGGVPNPSPGTYTPITASPVGSNSVTAVGTSQSNTPYIVLATGGLSVTVGGFQQVYGPAAVVGPTGQTVQQLLSSGWSYADIADMIAMSGTTPNYSGTISSSGPGDWQGLGNWRRL